MKREHGQSQKVGAGLHPGSFKELEPDVIALQQNEVSGKIPGEKYVQKSDESQSREKKQLERSCTPVLNVKVGAGLHQKVGAGLHPGSVKELEPDAIALQQKSDVIALQHQPDAIALQHQSDAIALHQQELQTKETTKIPGEKVLNRLSRYISVYRKREVGERCSHFGCPRPADVIHHPDRFSGTIAMKTSSLFANNIMNLRIMGFLR